MDYTMTASDERWVPILAIDPRYSISDAGRVRGPSGRVLKPTLMQIGYLSVALSVKNGKVSRHYVHRLVAQAFLGPLPKGMVVNHINHQKIDNRAANLEIIPRSSNGSHWASLGRSPKTKKIATGVCGRGHPFHVTRSGKSYCQVCRKARKDGRLPDPPTDTEWRPITLGVYLVSSDGRVWSLRTHRLLRHGINRPGYCYVNLRIDGRQKPSAIHRLVAEAFLGGVPDGEVVDHINGNKEDNRATNLRVLSRSANIRVFHDQRRLVGKHGFKYTESTIAAIKRDLNADRYTLLQIAERNGVSRSHVGNIKYGGQWKHIASHDDPIAPQ
jgi:hypothetical protein